MHEKIRGTSETCLCNQVEGNIFWGNCFSDQLKCNKITGEVDIIQE